MKKFKKGEKVFISTFRGVIEQEVVSCGGKFITTDTYKFNAETLRDINGTGFTAYIIEDIEAFHQERERMVILSEIEKFNFKKLSLEDADKIRNILDSYKEKEDAQVRLQM